MSAVYLELLKDPRWQRRRLEILERDGWKCTSCGDDKKTLHVHHKFYDGRKPWEYEPEALATLCVDCHAKETDDSRILKAAIRKLDSGDLLRVAGYIEAIIAARECTPLLISDAQMALGAADAFGITDDEVIDDAIKGKGTIEYDEVFASEQCGSWLQRTRKDALRKQGDLP